MTVARVVAVDDRGVAGAADAQHRDRGADAAAGARHADDARAPGRASRGRAAPRRPRGRTARAGCGCGRGTRTPALAAMSAASLPTMRRVEAAAGEDRVAHPVALVGRRARSAPCRSISRRNRSATASSTISTLSLVHRIELSKALLATSFSAARLQVGGGVDEHGHVAGADADRRVARASRPRAPPATPPVARMTSVRSSVISASISGIDGSSTTWTTPSGAPAATAASPSTRAASAQHSLANGCGLTTTALRVSSASSTLK